MSSLEKLASGIPVRDESATSYKVKQTTETIPEEHMQEAFDTTNKTAFVSKWPKVERYVTDPPFESQKFCLHSFIPAKGATPDKDGVYGFLKCRGTFSDQASMNQRAETILRTIDSFHDLYHGVVGAPMPFANNPDYAKETVDIDIKKKAVEEVSRSIESSREKDRQVINELKQREKELLESVHMRKDEKTGEMKQLTREEVEASETKEQREERMLDDYIAMRVKRATYLFTLMETKKKTDKIRENLKTVNEALLVTDKEHPEFIGKYKEKYEKEREKAGITGNNEFVRLLVEDVPEEELR